MTLLSQIRIILFLGLAWQSAHSQHISDFLSVAPGDQDASLHLPPTHTFQYVIEHGDDLTDGGTIPDKFDFTGYVPIEGSSTNGFLSINSELTSGGVSVLDIFYDESLSQWQITRSVPLDFSPWGGTSRNCSGTITPWNTVISCEEAINAKDDNDDGYFDYGWAVEIDPDSKVVLDKLWALGNFEHENAVIHENRRTVYQGVDADPGYLYKFVAEVESDLSSGLLYVYKGSKSGDGEWILIPNTTINDRNRTKALSAAEDATVFDGIEDVEIGPDGRVYLAVKGESRVYRLQDEDPLTGDGVTNFETYVGAMSYDIEYDGGVATEPWGRGNDNLAFDNLGNLWVFQDGGRNYIWLVKQGHSQDTPQVEIFGRTPAGSEPTGITFTPDFKYMFMSIQSPNSSNSSESQPDAFGEERAFDKDVAIVIARREDLGAGTVPTIESEIFGIELFPNPTSAILHISIPKNVVVSQIKLFDASGQLLSEESCWGVGEWDLDLRDISPGVFYVVFESQQPIQSVKVIKF